MWKPWQWAVASQATALANARSATTEASRRRVQREEVDLFLAELGAGRRPEAAPRVGAG